MEWGSTDAHDGIILLNVLLSGPRIYQATRAVAVLRKVLLLAEST